MEEQQSSPNGQGKLLVMAVGSGDVGTSSSGEKQGARASARTGFLKKTESNQAQKRQQRYGVGQPEPG